MSSEEFTEWQAYYSLEPWGEDRADKRTALVAWVIAQVNGNKKAKLNDFLACPPPEKPGAMARAFRASLAHLVKRKT
jgi:hypothetical protein